MLFYMLKNSFYGCTHHDQTFSVGYIVLLSTKNLILPGIHKLQPWFIGPYRVMSTWPGTYRLDLPPSITAVHPWFYISLLKPAGPQTAGPLALVDHSYEVEALLQINKCGIQTKVKWVGCDSSHNQYIQLSKLLDTDLMWYRPF